MAIELEKDLMIGMLTVLGKLINRNATDPVRKALRIEAQEGVLTFRVHSAIDRLAYRLETPTPETFIAHVDFDAFRDAVRTCRSRMMEFGFTGSALNVGGTSVPLAEVNWPASEVHSKGLSCTLPEKVIDMFAYAAQVVNPSDIRQALHGINLNRIGITATNSKEMVHIPCSLMLESVTIPVPVALIQSKCEEGGRFSFWLQDKKTWFCMTIGPWEWTAPALSESFPNWRSVVPKEDSLRHRFTFTHEVSEELQTALRGLNDPNDELAVTLSKSDSGKLEVQAGGLRLQLEAEFEGPWAKAVLGVNRKILLHILSHGHTSIAFGDTCHAPFIATGGVGRFIAMSLNLSFIPKTTKEDPVYTKEVNVGEPGTVPVASPLDELSESIENFRAKLKSLFEESAVLLRKVREAALQQKQKEREFVQARKAIERIRMAI